LVAQPVDLLHPSLARLIKALVVSRHGACIDVEFDWRERSKECLDDGLVNGVARYVLAHRDAVLLAQVIA
jgi:hypothetical protein